MTLGTCWVPFSRRTCISTPETRATPKYVVRCPKTIQAPPPTQEKHKCEQKTWATRGHSFVKTQRPYIMTKKRPQVARWAQMAPRWAKPMHHLGIPTKARPRAPNTLFDPWRLQTHGHHHFLTKCPTCFGNPVGPHCKTIPPIKKHRQT